MDLKREIIYIDAGKNGNNFKISIYHLNSNKSHILELQDIKDSNQAEKYAAYYAILYIKRYEYKNCIILSDSKATLQDKILLSILKDLHIQISWIPREINQIADKNCKQASTLDKCEFNVLKLFVDLSQKAYIQHNTLQEIEKLKKEKEKLSIKIKNQAEQINHLRKKG